MRWLLLLALASGPPALAEELIIAGQAVPPATAPLGDQVEIDARTHALSKGLRCPVCQGLSVADSSSDAAVNMKNRIRELIAAGYSEAQIEDYFIDRYGTWVLLDPPDVGVNRVLQLGPGIAMALGAAGVGFLLWRQLKRPAAPAPAPAPPSVATDDPYARRVLDELEDV
ncbi:MAG: cytochrome c-type biogenesis protein CcmH [Alphaproteobacteria bacterium]|nr:cytochrome c-type biogenesis protein CcmH [Alphaproteobacteria bacterium]